MTLVRALVVDQKRRRNYGDAFQGKPCGRRTVEIGSVRPWGGVPDASDSAVQRNWVYDEQFKRSTVLEVCVLARDAQHAIKIAADKFREFVAQPGFSWD